MVRSLKGLTLGKQYMKTSSEPEAALKFARELSPRRRTSKAKDIDGLPANASNPALDGGFVHSYHLETTCIEELSPDWLESHADVNLDHPGSSTALMSPSRCLPDEWMSRR